MTPSTDPVVSSSAGADSARAEIGVIGGSGFYEFLADAERISINTPFGEPSDDVVIGEVDGRRLAFLARHGQGHRFPPHLRVVGEVAGGIVRLGLTFPEVHELLGRQREAVAAHGIYADPALRHIGLPAGEMSEMTVECWNSSFDKLAASLV